MLSTPEKNRRTLYWKMLFNYSDYLGLSDQDVSKITKIRVSTITNWRNRPDKSIPISSVKNKKFMTILSLSILFNSLTSWYEKKDAQLNWLSTPHSSFNNKSPLEYLKDKNNTNAINDVGDYLNQIRGM